MIDLTNLPRWRGWLDDQPMPTGPFIADVRYYVADSTKIVVSDYFNHDSHRSGFDS
jgi:hypothetical protein